MATNFDASKLVLNLEAIRQKVAGEAARRAARAGARVVGAAMMERSPVTVERTTNSDALEPGELRSNIKVRTRSQIVDGVATAMAGPKLGRIGRAAYNVEFGHRMVTGSKSELGPDGVFRGGGTVHEQDVPAHPFLRPAFEASAAEALEAAGESLREDFNPEAK